MNGKEIIWSLNYVSDSIVEEAEYGVLPVRSERQLQKEKSGSIFRRPLLVAAIIGLLLLLVGCAAYFYRLEQLVLIDHSKDVIATVEAYKQEMQSEETAEHPLLLMFGQKRRITESQFQLSNLQTI